jgi:DNA-binding response OmpR family regulator
MATRVMVAEDDESIGFIIQFKLEHARYHVTWKRDGAAAWKAIQDHPPDLVILDIMMPRMSGFQLLEKIKSTETTRHIPAIMVTARAAHEDVNKCLNLGAVGYILKPFKPEDLLARVKRIKPPPPLQPKPTPPAVQWLQKFD